MHALLPKGGDRGFTLIELMLVVAILGILATIGGTRYTGFIEKARAAEAISDIKNTATMIDGYEITEGDFPDFLTEVGATNLTDPWGYAYRYLKDPGNNMGQARKDMFLVPINSDYDLYSIGPDGDSKPPLQNPMSHDDIIRANDGGYIGVAINF